MINGAKKINSKVNITEIESSIIEYNLCLSDLLDKNGKNALDKTD